MSIEQEIVGKLRVNLEAADRAIAAEDWVAYRALAEQEARYVDILTAIWHPA